MAKNTILENALRGKVPEGAGNIALDDLRSMLEVMLARIMEAEVTARVAADRFFQPLSLDSIVLNGKGT